ncbi:hypothetical protein ACFTAO_33890 [Paenibacillus rhizoplanae]
MKSRQLWGKTTKSLQKDYRLNITQDQGQTSIEVVQDGRLRFLISIRILSSR